MVPGKIQKRLFGTNGVRGIVGSDMTPELSMKIGAAFGTMRHGCIAIGRDTRTSGEGLASALKAGLMACGCDVVDVGIIPTPGLQYVIKGRFNGGAMITASHNPPEYNGIKIIDSDGTEMADEGIIQLEEILFNQKFDIAPWDQVGSEQSSPHLTQEYVKGVLSHFPRWMGKGMVVVVDPGSGAGTITTPPLLSAFGCKVFTINATIDGSYSGRLPEPSQEGLEGLANLVKSVGAAFGVAHDGDADRAVFIDEKGRFIEENREFGLIEQFICKRQEGTIVTPVSTSLLIEAIAKVNGSNVEYTPVGSIYVARRMIELIENNVPIIFGGEGNGGLIYPHHQFCRDGLMTTAMMVYILNTTNRPLSSLVDELPKYYMKKEKIATPKGENIIKILEKTFSNEKINRTDGIKIIREHGWALIRASGTEPLIRIVVESDRENAVNDFFEEVMINVQNAIKQV